MFCWYSDDYNQRPITKQYDAIKSMSKNVYQNQTGITPLITSIKIIGLILKSLTNLEDWHYMYLILNFYHTVISQNAFNSFWHFFDQVMSIHLNVYWKQNGAWWPEGNICRRFMSSIRTRDLASNVRHIE